MKKVVCFILSLIMIVFCVACTSGKTPPDNVPDNRDEFDKNFDYSKHDLSESGNELKKASEIVWMDGEGNNVFSSETQSYPFYTDMDDNGVYAMNAMYEKFSNVSGQGGAVWEFGYEPLWWDWLADICMWSNNTSRKGKLKNLISDAPINEDGYLWAWHASPHWEGGVYNNKYYIGSDHFDQMPRYVIAVAKVLAWEGNTDFLYVKDTANFKSEICGCGKDHSTEDVSRGKTVRDKLDMVMKYMLEDMNGKSGIICIDNGKNTGELYSQSSNYWDNLCFGYYDPYEGMLFYDALLKMAQIERMCENELKANEYVALAETVKEKYVEKYFDTQKMRLISTEDINGVRYDFGLSFLNVEAASYGLLSKEKTTAIYSWLTGNRIIESDQVSIQIGDTEIKGVTGKAIYGNYQSAMVTNTLPYEYVMTDNEINGLRRGWFHYANDNIVMVNKDKNGKEIQGNAGFGKHLENGGAIFYPQYYDVMARTKILGADFGLSRVLQLANEYAKSAFEVVNGKNITQNSWEYGMYTVFPESGLVPISFLHGFVGVNANEKGLVIAPSFPQAYSKIGAKDVNYANGKYDIEVSKDGKVTISAAQKIGNNFVIKNYANKTTLTVTVQDSNGNILNTHTYTPDIDNNIYLEFRDMYRSGGSIIVS